MIHCLGPHFVRSAPKPTYNRSASAEARSTADSTPVSSCTDTLEEQRSGQWTRVDDTKDEKHKEGDDEAGGYRGGWLIGASTGVRNEHESSKCEVSKWKFLSNLQPTKAAISHSQIHILHCSIYTRVCAYKRKLKILRSFCHIFSSNPRNFFAEMHLFLTVSPIS